MAATKTKFTGASVGEFLAKVEDPQKRADSAVLIEMMERITGEEPRMWGPTIIGFGRYHYKYDSGHEGESCRAAFSPRDAELSIYLSGYWKEIEERHNALLKKLGKHRTGKSCLYVKRLENVDLKVLEELVQLSYDAVNARYPN
jgi:hypothetical protein